MAAIMRSADLAQHRASELGEEALDEIEPRAVRGREGESIFHVVHRQFSRSPESRHDFLSMPPNQPSAYMPWRKTESSRIASIGSVSRNRCTSRTARPPH